MKKSMENGSPTLASLFRGLVGIGALFFLLSMCLAVANMVLRPFGHAISGTYELMGYSCAAFVALGLGFSALEKVHIAVDIMMRFLPRDVARSLESMGYAISGVSSLIASYGLWSLTTRYMKVHEVSETLHLPFYPVVALVALGFFLLGLAFLKNAVKVFK